MAEQIFKPENYDLIGFKIFVIHGFDLYNELHALSKVPQYTLITKNKKNK